MILNRPDCRNIKSMRHLSIRRHTALLLNCILNKRQQLTLPFGQWGERLDAGARLVFLLEQNHVLS